ncbi:MAG TPA: hypothetical protein VFN74_07215 [Chloroflexota bacterium]|nr:hypothetical protein [Chloroflexota bacterium]
MRRSTPPVGGGDQLLGDVAGEPVSGEPVQRCRQGVHQLAREQGAGGEGDPHGQWGGSDACIGGRRTQPEVERGAVDDGAPQRQLERLERGFDEQEGDDAGHRERARRPGQPEREAEEAQTLHQAKSRPLHGRRQDCVSIEFREESA